MNLDALLRRFGAIGTSRTWILLIVCALAVSAYVGAYLWIQTRIGWPEAFDVQCNRRRCSLTYIFNSYKLLGGKDIFAYLFFVVLNLPVIAVVGVPVANVIRERRLGARGQTKPEDHCR